MNFSELIAKGGALFLRKKLSAVQAVYDAAPASEKAAFQASVSLEQVFTASAGVEVNYAGISARLSGTGNKSLQFKVGADESASYISEAKSGTYAIAQFDPALATAAWQYVDPNRNFDAAGSIQECSISLLTSARLYKLTLVVGAGYNNNIITIRRVK